MRYNRRSFLKATLGGAAVVAAGCSAASPIREDGEDVTFYVGTYTSGSRDGIYLGVMNAETGEISIRESFGGVENPSFLAVDGAGRYLFAASETGSFAGRPVGSVASFAIDSDTASLTKLSQEASGGASPAYVSVDEAGRFVLVANYSGGNVALLPVDDEGRLGSVTSLMQHSGSSAHPQRQRGPHAHSVQLDPSERYAIAADLGIDKLMIHRVEAGGRLLEPADPPYVSLHAGAGPRHLAFSPEGDRLYVINELDSTVTAYTYDGSAGTFTSFQTISTLPEGFSGQNTSADIHVAPSGSFVYGSNRGHDSIVVYSVESDSGRLTQVQHQSTEGHTPRNFALDPSGRFLIAANQDSNSLVVFSVDEASGLIEPTGAGVSVPTPVCVLFLKS